MAGAGVFFLATDLAAADLALARDGATATLALPVAAGRCDRGQLRRYSRLWLEGEGGKQAQFYRLRKFVFSLDDEDYDALAGSVLRIPAEKRTILSILKSALLRKPSLLLDAVKLFT